MSNVEIRRLEQLPLEDLMPLVIEAEQEGWQFLRRMFDEWNAGINRFNKPGEAMFGAWHNQQLVGVCGLNVDPYITDSTVGRVRRLYVSQAFRGHGIGNRLVLTVIDWSQSHFSSLRVRTNNPEAARLYERLGFAHITGITESTHVLSFASQCTFTRLS